MVIKPYTRLYVDDFLLMSPSNEKSLGVVKYNKYNLRSKLDFKLADWWTVGNNTSYVISDYNSPKLFR